MATELQTFLYINIHLLSVDTKSLLVKIHSCLNNLILNQRLRFTVLSHSSQISLSVLVVWDKRKLYNVLLYCLY